MASLILLFSEVVRNHELDAASLLATYPPSSCAAATGSSAARKSTINQNDKLKSQSIEDVQNPLDSRVCVDFVWP